MHFPGNKDKATARKMSSLKGTITKMSGLIALTMQIFLNFLIKSYVAQQ